MLVSQNMDYRQRFTGGHFAFVCFEVFTIFSAEFGDDLSAAAVLADRPVEGGVIRPIWPSVVSAISVFYISFVDISNVNHGTQRAASEFYGFQGHGVPLSLTDGESTTSRLFEKSSGYHADRFAEVLAAGDRTTNVREHKPPPFVALSIVANVPATTNTLFAWVEDPKASFRQTLSALIDCVQSVYKKCHTHCLSRPVPDSDLKDLVFFCRD